MSASFIQFGGPATIHQQYTITGFKERPDSFMAKAEPLKA